MTRIRLGLALCALIYGAGSALMHLVQGDGFSAVVTLMMYGGIALLVLPDVS